MKNCLRKSVAMMLAVSLLTGCSLGGSKVVSVDKPTTLKVMYNDERAFFQDYGMVFSALHPNVNIQVVSTGDLYSSSEDGEPADYEKAKQELIDKEKPDLIMIDFNEYKKMAKQGKLYDLETFMIRDKFNTEGLVPGLIDHMKQLGGGQVYALPSGVSSRVIYYNKALFDKYNIPHPTDQMSWFEVIHLARQFPIEGEPEDRVYGLETGNRGGLYGFSTMLAKEEGLSSVDSTTKQMTINSSGWVKVVQTALDAIKSNTLYSKDQSSMMNKGSSSYQDSQMSDPFIDGRLAMRIDGSYYITQIKEAAKYLKDEESAIKEWGIVTVPVSTQYPDESNGAWYGSIFGITKDSPNADDAWKFISYISSEEYSRIKAKTEDYYALPIHTKHMKDDEGRNFAAFYKLKPATHNNNPDYNKLPPQFGMLFNDLMLTEFKEIQEGNKDIEEALQFLQEKGQELLAQEPMTDEEVDELMKKQIEKLKRAGVF